MSRLLHRLANAGFAALFTGMLVFVRLVVSLFGPTLRAWEASLPDQYQPYIPSVGLLLIIVVVVICGVVAIWITEDS